MSERLTMFHDQDEYGELSPDGEPLCLVCGGEGIVDGSDYLEWDEDSHDDLIDCTSCHGTGMAKDMTWA